MNDEPTGLKTEIVYQNRRPSARGFFSKNADARLQRGEGPISKTSSPPDMMSA